MKVEKVIFSSSEQYSDFWNLQSKVFKEGLGIEPVCYLFGKKKNTDMTEEYGKVHEVEFIEGLPKIIQITWAKFYYPKLEPETVWMTGDLDLIPLQRDHFIKKIEHCEEDSYLHLNWDACNPRGGAGFVSGPPLVALGGNNLPGQYHVAKGKVFEDTYGRDASYEEQIKDLLSSIMSARSPGGLLEGDLSDPNVPSPDQEKYWWVAEESYSSAKLWQRVVQKQDLRFYGFGYRNPQFPVHLSQRIDRYVWDDVKDDYIYDLSRLQNKQYVDVHCARGFGAQCDHQNWWNKEEGFAKAPTGFKRYEKQTTRIVRESGILQK